MPAKNLFGVDLMVIRFATRMGSENLRKPKGVHSEIGVTRNPTIFGGNATSAYGNPYGSGVPLGNHKEINLAGCACGIP